jgi:hypothetical protein
MMHGQQNMNFYIFMQTRNRNSDSCWPCYFSIFWRRSWSVWFLWQKRACLLSVEVPGDVRIVLLLLYKHGVLVWRDRTSIVKYSVVRDPVCSQATDTIWMATFGILCRPSSFVCLSSGNQWIRLALANSLFGMVKLFFFFPLEEKFRVDQI